MFYMHFCTYKSQERLSVVLFFCNFAYKFPQANCFICISRLQATENQGKPRGRFSLSAKHERTVNRQNRMQRSTAANCIITDRTKGNLRKPNTERLWPKAKGSGEVIPAV